MTTTPDPTRPPDDERRRKRMWAILGVAAVALLAAGVGLGLLLSGGDDDTAGPPATSTTVTEPTTTTAPPTTTLPASCTLPGGGTATRTEAGTADRTMMGAVGVRPAGVATEGRPSGVPDCAENVVFAFSGIGTDAPGTLPGVRAEYRDASQLTGPSGDPVPVSGNAFLVVRFEPAQNHTDDGVGPIAPEQLAVENTMLVREVRQIEDFEGVVVYAIGLDHQVPFSVGRGGGSTWWLSFAEG